MGVLVDLRRVSAVAGAVAYHGSPVVGLKELLPREHQAMPDDVELTFNSLGVWVTSDQVQARRYGKEVYEVEVPDGKYLDGMKLDGGKSNKYGLDGWLKCFTEYDLLRPYLKPETIELLDGRVYRGTKIAATMFAEFSRLLRSYGFAPVPEYRGSFRTPGGTAVNVEERRGSWTVRGWHDVTGTGVVELRKLLDDMVADRLLPKPVKQTRQKKVVAPEYALFGTEIRDFLQGFRSEPPAPSGRREEAVIQEVAHDVVGVVFRSWPYLKAWRQRQVSNGYDGVVWKDSYIDRLRSGPPHDVYLIWNHVPVKVRQRVASVDLRVVVDVAAQGR